MQTPPDADELREALDAICADLDFLVSKSAKFVDNFADAMKAFFEFVWGTMKSFCAEVLNNQAFAELLKSIEEERLGRASVEELRDEQLE